MLQKFWPLFALIAVGLVTLALIGLDTSGESGTKGEFPKTITKADGQYAVDEGDSDDAVKLPSGLSYIDVVVGDGKEAKPGDKVEVHYTGWLADTKKVFDSSKKRNEPFSFTLGIGKVIQGWDQGVPGMKEGGKRKLMIPANLGYGPRGSPPAIPANADLVFAVELVKVK